MKYLEDSLSEKMIDELESEIAKVCNDDTYILCILSAFDNDEEAKILLDFLLSHPNATTDDINYCTVDIRNSRKSNQ